MLIAGLVLGILIGVTIGYLYARGRIATATADLASQASAASERARAAEQRAALIDGQLAERFQSLSTAALDASTARFLEIADGRMRAENVKAAGELENRRAAVEHLVGPLKDTLGRLEAQLRDSDSARRASHAALAEQVNLTRHAAAARSPGPLGRAAAAAGSGTGRHVRAL